MKYLRLDRMPHVWCPGCGNGTVLKAAVGAIDELGLDPNKIAVISGIGCSSRATGYLNFNTMHTLHGRAIAFATGVKLARPEMTVIVLTGDGDLAAIGGNHFIHAARRNMDITVVCFNNNIYGMTGGQYSPTTPDGSYATTAPYGNLEPSFDLSQLAIASGATYVARSTTYHFIPLQTYIRKGIVNQGFSFVEAITQCPTYFGRYNQIGTAPKMMEHFKEKALTFSRLQNELQTGEEKRPAGVSQLLEVAREMYPDRILIGEFLNKAKPGYVEQFLNLVKQLEEPKAIPAEKGEG